MAREQAFECAADKKGGGKEAEGKGEEGEEVEVGQAVGEVFVEAEHQERLRGADAGEHEGQGDDEAAGDLEDEATQAASAEGEKVVGQARGEEDEGEAETEKEGVSPVKSRDVGFAPDKGEAAEHSADEEPARGHVEVGEQDVAHQFGDGDDAEAGAGAKGEEEGEAGFGLFKDVADRGDELVVAADDDGHRAARDAGNGHGAADPEALEKRGQTGARAAWRCGGAGVGGGVGVGGDGARIGHGGREVNRAWAKENALFGAGGRKRARLGLGDEGIEGDGGGRRVAWAVSAFVGIACRRAVAGPMLRRAPQSQGARTGPGAHLAAGCPTLWPR